MRGNSGGSDRRYFNFRPRCSQPRRSSSIQLEMPLTSPWSTFTVAANSIRLF
jgi:hypothetical protein